MGELRFLNNDWRQKPPPNGRLAFLRGKTNAGVAMGPQSIPRIPYWESQRGERDTMLRKGDMNFMNQHFGVAWTTMKIMKPLQTNTTVKWFILGPTLRWQWAVRLDWPKESNGIQLQITSNNYICCLAQTVALIPPPWLTPRDKDL